MTCSSDGSLEVWNLQTGEQISNWRDESSITAITLAMNEKEVASGSEDGVVRLWSIETGEVIAKWTGHTDTVNSACWNGGGVQVLSGSWDGIVRLWDIETGNTVLQINTGLRVYIALFSPELTLIATGGYNDEDERIKIWDANTGKLIAILKGHTTSMFCLAWAGRTLISGSLDNTIRTWDTSTWQQLAVLTSHTNTVCSVAISPNGRILASASWDKTARLWDLRSSQPIASLRHPRIVKCVSFSTDGTLLATACDDKNAYTWNIPAIIKDADLDVLLEDSEKPLLHADATRRPVQQPKNVRTIPTSFFTEPPAAQHPDSQPTIAHPITPPSVAHDSDAPPELELEPSPTEPEPAKSRFFQWLQTRRTFLHPAQLLLSRQPQSCGNEGMEMQERSPSITDVPLAQGLLRHANEWGVRRNKEKQKQRKKEEKEDMKKEKEENARQARIAKIAEGTGTTNRPHTDWNNPITQPAAGPSRAKPFSELQAADTSLNFSVPANAAPLTASSTPRTNAIILRPRCCIPILSCLGCASEYFDGRQ